MYDQETAQRIHDQDIFAKQKQLLSDYEVRSDELGHEILRCFASCSICCVLHWSPFYDCVNVLRSSSVVASQARYKKSGSTKKLIPWVSIKTEVPCQVRSTLRFCCGCQKMSLFVWVVLKWTANSDCLRKNKKSAFVMQRWMLGPLFFAIVVASWSAVRCWNKKKQKTFWNISCAFWITDINLHARSSSMVCLPIRCLSGEWMRTVFDLRPPWRWHEALVISCHVICLKITTCVLGTENPAFHFSPYFSLRQGRTSSALSRCKTSVSCRL